MENGNKILPWRLCPPLESSYISVDEDERARCSLAYLSIHYCTPDIRYLDGFFNSFALWSGRWRPQHDEAA